MSMTISNPYKLKKLYTSERDERNVFMHIFTAKLGWNTKITYWYKENRSKKKKWAVNRTLNFSAPSNLYRT